MDKPRKTIVIGAGPVGSLAALYAAKRGDDVEIYELRSDLRSTSTTPLNFTKSINLALSERGINAIRNSGINSLLPIVLQQTIPMYGRMIHTRSTITSQLEQQTQLYDVHGRFLRSVDRGVLNTVLLDELEKLSNVKFFFHHKLTGADFIHKKAWFEVKNPDWDPFVTGQRRPPEVEVSFDLMLGADGAHSATRFHLMKYAHVNYQQEYIDCLWCEFTMEPTAMGDFAIHSNRLHIWPAGDFMFIALPNIDKSFTCTLFGPNSLFRKLGNGTDEDLIQLFDKHFPGVTDLIPKDDLIAQWKRNPHLPLINIKCSPHHYEDTVVILGDAANAIVPFYGQGMNAGLESVRVLFEKLSQHPTDTKTALSEYTTFRTQDTYAIANLALQNYVEMRSSVTSPTYKIRKFIEESLYKYTPKLGWATQYSRVSFENMRYSEVIKRTAHQKKILENLLTAFVGIPAASIVLWVLFRLIAKRRQR